QRRADTQTHHQDADRQPHLEHGEVVLEELECTEDGEEQNKTRRHHRVNRRASVQPSQPSGAQPPKILSIRCAYPLYNHELAPTRLNTRIRPLRRYTEPWPHLTTTPSRSLCSTAEARGSYFSRSSI